MGRASHGSGQGAASTRAAPKNAVSPAASHRTGRVAGRRAVLAGGLAAAGLLAAPALAQGAGRVVVVGGGAAGATLARYVAKDAPGVSVTLINERPQHTTGSFSNLYLAGYRSLASLTHRYDLLASRHGVEFIADRAVSVDRSARQVRLASGAEIAYDRLALCPGVALQHQAIEGYDPAARETMPHGYAGGYQSFLLRRRLTTMRPGGVFVIAAPPNPYSCPPAPYERASMAARLFARTNPTAKILIFDAKDAFQQQRLFQAAWETVYPSMIEWTPASFSGGGVIGVDAAAGTVRLGSGQTVQADVACIIPPQQAGELVAQAGLADDGGWAPVDPNNFRSLVDPDCFVVGDSSRAGDMPKSAYAANSQAKAAALAIRAELVGAQLFPSRYRNTLWSFVDRQNVVKAGGSYRVEAGRVAEVSSFASTLEEPPRQRLDNALEANAWYASVTADMFA